MNAAASAPRSSGACYHCALPLPAAPVAASLAGEVRQFCCSGCAAAARWIHDSRLDDYYRLRSEAGGRALADPVDLGAWDRPDIQAAHGRNVPGGCEIVLLTDAMHCAACAWLIDRALQRESGVREVSANAVTGRIRIVWDPAQRRLSQILQRLLALGYRPFLASGTQRELARRAEARRWILRIGLAGLAAMQAMMFAEALYLDTTGQMADSTRDFFRWVTFLVATPVVFWSGWPFLAGAWRELRARAPGMDTLVALSTLLAWGASTVEMLRGGPHVWFDAAVMFVFLLLVARMLEQRARRLASARVDALAQAQPLLAAREMSGGGIETVPVTELAAGDVVQVAAGETLPADGALLDAPAAMVEALLTGEAHPVARQVGDPVYAGSFCADRPLRLRVTGTGHATRLSALARLVQRAQESRPRAARVADRVASRFVIALLVAAVITWFAWLRIDPSRAFEVTLALLVISCPCALSLAVPAALAAAHAQLSRLGVLAVRPDALETLARTTDLVFDKTGTLGSGDWRIEALQAFDGCSAEQALQLAAALEQGVRHPVASAFRGVAAASAASGVRLQPGDGVEGTVDGRTLRIGTAAFAAGRDDDGAIWLGDGVRALARFELRELPRDEASATIAALAGQDLTLHLYSGDAEGAVLRFAQALDLPGVNTHGRLLPEQKLARVRDLQRAGSVVAMVGDGINDAPVLAGADVSIAVAGGAALAQQSADLVLTHPSLLRIPATFALARRTRADNPAEPGLGDRLQPAGATARGHRPCPAMDRGARDGDLLADRHAERAAPGARPGNPTVMSILLLLIPLSLRAAGRGDLGLRLGRAQRPVRRPGHAAARHTADDRKDEP